MPPEWQNPPTVNAPIAHYSQVAKSGNTLYISGQLGVDTSGQLVAVGDARAQARQAWRNVFAILEHYGATPLVGEARDEAFSSVSPPYPPSTLVVVAALAEPQYLVEIEAIAVLESS